eukprot:3236893-Rhodomonas_salina.2
MEVDTKRGTDEGSGGTAGEATDTRGAGAGVQRAVLARRHRGALSGADGAVERKGKAGVERG